MFQFFIGIKKGNSKLTVLPPSVGLETELLIFLKWTSYAIMRGGTPNVNPGQGGYLELSNELLDRLITKEPIEKFYEVEDEPFAR